MKKGILGAIVILIVFTWLAFSIAKKMERVVECKTNQIDQIFEKKGE